MGHKSGRKTKGDFFMMTSLQNKKSSFVFGRKYDLIDKKSAFPAKLTYNPEVRQENKRKFLLLTSPQNEKSSFVFFPYFPNYKRKGMGDCKGETVGFPLTVYHLS
jgi:hypothetical protein